MDGTLQYWTESVDISNLKSSIGRRKVYIWGAYAGGHSIYQFLEENGISVQGFIDAHKEETVYFNKGVWKPDQVIDVEKSYIIIAVIGIREEILSILSKNSYREENDYIYISSFLPEVTISSVKKNYSDSRGNKIEFLDDVLMCNITFIGFHNKVSIGNNFRCDKNAEIVVENGSVVTIGNDMRIEGTVRLEACEKGHLLIGNSCYIMKDSRISARGGKTNLGNYVTMGERFLCICAPHSPIEIGNDCMFSHDVTILSTNSHSIFDLELKENIALQNEKQVKIGSHVWLGKGSTVLYNSDIGNGSIVGACSLVKSQTPENCILAGNVAKVVRENCSWDRRKEITFDER